MRADEFIVELSFYGRTCTKDCSGHRAGWEWERKHQTNVKQATPSPSFNNGTDVAISQRKAGKHPIGSMARGAKGRFQKIQPVRESDQELDELTGVKKYQIHTLPDLIKAISDEFNLPVIGSGAFGTVLKSSDPNIVYKVVEQDDAYMSFVNFVLSNPNPHYPSFQKVKLMTAFYSRYKIQPNKFSVIKTEKLMPLPEGTANFVAGLALARQLNEIADELPNGQNNTYSMTYLELAETRQWIIDLWYAIRAIIKSKKIKGRPDLRMHNFMQRSDGTVVIIDPVADDKALSVKSRVQSLDIHEPETRITGPVYQPKKKINARKVK